MPEDIRKKAEIGTGDAVDISYKDGTIQVVKIDEDWDNVMNATQGVWREHPQFKDMDDAVEIMDWMRGKL